MHLPLQGFTVLDIGTLTPGKYCTFLLADLGASVLRIERPVAVRESISDEDLVLNRNKRSMTLNLRHADGRAILYRLAKTADVVLESSRPGVAQRLEIDYERLSSINPGVVYCSLSGFGQDGPYRLLPAYDLMFLGMSGVLQALVGDRQAPMVPGLYLADTVSGLMATIGIVTALVPRQKSGEGCYLDLSMLDSTFSILAVSQGMQRDTAGGHENEVTGASPAYNVYQTSDQRYIVLGIGRPVSWEALCHELGRPDLITQQAATGQEREAVHRFLRDTFKTASAAAWIERLRACDIEISPVNTLDEAYADPQLVARGMVLNTSHPDAGDSRQIAGPLGSLNRGAPGEISPAPTVGQHTDEVLLELGYQAPDIAQMRTGGII